MHLYLVFRIDDIGERHYVAHVITQSDHQFLRQMEHMLDSGMQVFRYNLTDEICNGTMTKVRYEELRFALVNEQQYYANSPTR